MKVRIEKSATIHLVAPIDKVFPLFGPIREKDWAYGWNPEIIFPTDSLVAKHMVFKTKGGLHGSSETYTWSVVHYDPETFGIEYHVSTYDRLWFITVQCKPHLESTSAQVTYSYTGFTPEANQKNQDTLTAMFASDLKDWEDALNYYLKTGKQLH